MTLSARSGPPSAKLVTVSGPRPPVSSPSRWSLPVATARRLVAAGLDLAAEMRREWSEDRVGGLAAEIAFFAVLGLFPAVLVLAAGLGLVDSVVGAANAAEAEAWIIARLHDTFGTENTLEATIGDLFRGSNAGALSSGIVLTLYAASRGFVAVVSALEVAYDHEHRRGWLSTRLVGLGLTLLTVLMAAVVVTMIVVGPFFGLGDALAGRLGVGDAFATTWNALQLPVAFLAVVVWAATTYHVAPGHRSPWRWELPGALLAASWFVVVSAGFGVYLGLASRGANAVFGLLGGALTLLFWLYLMAMGLIVGAELNAVVARRRGVEFVPRRRAVDLVARRVAVGRRRRPG